MHRFHSYASLASLALLLGSLPAAAQVGGPGSLRYTIVVPTPVDAENVSLGNIQDLDGDGARDLLIGIPGGPGGGRVEIWSTLGQNLLLTIAPATPMASFGWDVVNVDDLDGDGYDDVLIGAPHDSPGPIIPNTPHGVAFVYSSMSGALLRTIQPSAASVTASLFGWCVGRAGPINANPGGEVLIGAPGYRGSTGLVDCVDIAGASPVLVGTLLGAQVGEQFGFSVSGMRDNGQAHVVVGAPNHQVTGCGATSGAVRLFSGAALASGTASLIWSASCIGGLELGFAVASIGDFGADGVDEIGVGAPSVTNNSGWAIVLDGSTGLVVAAYTDVPHLGWSCARIGDQDSDGKPDVLFGAPTFLGIGVETQMYLSAGGGSWSPLPYPPPSTNFGVDVTGLGVVTDLTGMNAGGFAVVDASVLGAPGIATIYVYF